MVAALTVCVLIKIVYASFDVTVWHVYYSPGASITVIARRLPLYLKLSASVPFLGFLKLSEFCIHLMVGALPLCRKGVLTYTLPTVHVFVGQWVS